MYTNDAFHQIKRKQLDLIMQINEVSRNYNMDSICAEAVNKKNE